MIYKLLITLMENASNSIFFRNRLSILRNLLFGTLQYTNKLLEFEIIKEKDQEFKVNGTKNMNVDGMVIILGISSLNCNSQRKLFNWLFMLNSSIIDLEETSIPNEYLETFIVLTKNKLFIFTEESNKDFFIKITKNIIDLSIEFYFASTEELNENDIFQI